MYKPIILPLAKQDIKEAVNWYNGKQNGLGRRFTNAVRSKVEFLCKNPKSVAIRYDETYCAVLDVFPYMIHFSIDERKKIIIISAVFHTSLNPRK